jgi:hypothetical protein
MAAYCTDIQSVNDYNGKNINADIPTWQLFADILKGARIYE